MEQQGTEATQTQPTSEVDSSPADVPALPVTEILSPRRWEQADLRTGAADCSSPGCHVYRQFIRPRKSGGEEPQLSGGHWLHPQLVVQDGI